MAHKRSLDSDERVNTHRKVEEVKNLRVVIDGAIKEARETGNIRKEHGPGGRELSFVITKLQEAKMWAGMILGELGEKLPEKYRDEAK